MLLYGCNLLQFFVIKKFVTLAEKKSHQSHHWMIFGPCNFARPTVGAHPATKPIQLSQPMGRTQPANPTRRPFARVRTDPPLSLSHSIFGGGGGRWRVSGMAVWRAVGARAVLRRLGAAAETAGRCDGGVLPTICSSSGNATSGLGKRVIPPSFDPLTPHAVLYSYASSVRSEASKT